MSSTSIPDLSCARLRVLIATAGGIGHLRPGPGTWASIAAAAAGLAAMQLNWSPVVLLVAALVALALGTWSVPAALHRFDCEDPPQVVVDEVAGQWAALALMHAAAVPAPPWLTVLTACALFRLFDIVKPWPVDRLERLPGATGVMADDLLAGVLAGLVASVLLG